MKKKFIILIVLIAMLSCSTVAQIKVNSSGKVAIGSGDPSSSYLLKST